MMNMSGVEANLITWSCAGTGGYQGADGEGVRSASSVEGSRCKLAMAQKHAPLCEVQVMTHSHSQGKQ